ncbi:hypothetical protein L198_06766 [Cryptococcus wingfieldii CBS 7118]|uniref:Zn(2)-C6 fungal-type domain-containing protein n=1 Tax=Cryptococcus wingfieldii CBS 7118 TaxID=1295528 RepID=A0A1E3IIS4_9TREE|nr:hypothetical protein L198_06766 [Cryptococcus wingfieldii CBS 7118]ODN88494.1 hypothetical protein L198_06766 [Cryptococcus wingfieldii CBS 7118]
MSGDPRSTSINTIRVHRACDSCRRRKVRCEGSQDNDAGGKCPSCIHGGHECTYMEDSQRPKGPSKRYVTMLEQKVGRLESILRQTESYVGPRLESEGFVYDTYIQDLRSRNIPPYPALKPLSLPTPSTSHAPSPALSIFSSTQSAHVKDENDKDEPSHAVLIDSDLKSARGIRSDIIVNMGQSKREAFWETSEWETSIEADGTSPMDFKVWPERGLDQLLINTYFDEVDLHMPLLNRLVFQEQYDAKLWRTSEGFAKICMLVFANGARYVKDRRVLWDSATPGDNSISQFSGGWKYFRVVLRMGRNIMQLPTLYDIQYLVLVCDFIHASSCPQLIATISSLGLRFIQELGAHISAVLAQWDPVERALYHRAFWCLYHIDRYGSSTVGRPVAVLDSDFDVPELANIDDEYWEREDLDGRGKQPEGKVSRVAFFIEISKVDRIMGKTLNRIYGTKKPADVHISRRQMVDELDADLRTWADNVPPPLRWDPKRSNYSLLRQSADMWAHGHYARILIHRNFVPARPNTGTLEQLYSLASCVHAAYAICAITDALLSRGRQEECPAGHALPVTVKIPSWLSGIILLLSLYTIDMSKEELFRTREGLKSCLRASQELEKLWQKSGKTTDFLQQAVNEADFMVSRMADEPSKPESTVNGDLELSLYNPAPHSSSTYSPFGPTPGTKTSNGMEAQEGLYNSWLRMSTFQSQLLDMNLPSRGREEQEEGIGDEWWAKMLDDHK